VSRSKILALAIRLKISGCQVASTQLVYLSVASLAECTHVFLLNGIINFLLL